MKDSKLFEIERVIIIGCRYYASHKKKLFHIKRSYLILLYLLCTQKCIYCIICIMISIEVGQWFRLIVFFLHTFPCKLKIIACEVLHMCELCNVCGHELKIFIGFSSCFKCIWVGFLICVPFYIVRHYYQTQFGDM